MAIPEQIEIPPQFLHPDPTLASLLGAIRVALSEDAYGSAIYVDYLSRAIASNLVRRYSGLTAPPPTPPLGPTGVVSPVTTEAIEFMRANLERSISLEDIARAVNRSASHVARLSAPALAYRRTNTCSTCASSTRRTCCSRRLTRSRRSPSRAAFLTRGA